LVEAHGPLVEVARGLGVVPLAGHVVGGAVLAQGAVDDRLGGHGLPRRAQSVLTSAPRRRGATPFVRCRPRRGAGQETASGIGVACRGRATGIEEWEGE